MDKSRSVGLKISFRGYMGVWGGIYVFCMHMVMCSWMGVWFVLSDLNLFLVCRYRWMGESRSMGLILV